MVFSNLTTWNSSINLTSDATTWLLQLSLWPLRIVCPLLFILCPIANWICISIFQSRTYSRSSSKWYFICIAIFDTVYVLVTAPLIFLLTFQIYILNWNILLCKSFVFLNYFSCQISAGLLACLSIDRLIATSCLLVYRYHCTTQVSKYVCFFVIVIFSLVNSHYLIGYTIDSNGHCSMRHYQWYARNYSRLSVVYLLSYSILPFTIISISNLFIVTSVCQSKSMIRKKYLMKKSALATNQLPVDQAAMHLGQCCLTASSSELKEEKVPRSEQPSNPQRQRIFVSINDDPVLEESVPPNSDWQPDGLNYPLEKLLLYGEETINPVEPPSLSKHQRNSSLDPRQLLVVPKRHNSASSNYSQKICIQLQITVSLIAISISFIFCTLPNCISTIMIQTHSDNEDERKFWQAMNYFSIVPLLITHSVNLIFYYLSSNMFRDRFREIYCQPRKSH